MNKTNINASKDNIIINVVGCDNGNETNVEIETNYYDNMMDEQHILTFEMFEFDIEVSCKDNCEKNCIKIDLSNYYEIPNIKIVFVK